MMSATGNRMKEISSTKLGEFSNSNVVYLNQRQREIVSSGYIRKMSKDAPLSVIKLIIDFYGLIGSNIKSENNPSTIRRMKKIEQGIDCYVYFDEKVIVHEVPLECPSRVYYDWANDEPPTDNNGCCILL
mmetsp:Transcript_68562/g.61597  ORF Transcript_68562/g.61597 Transcript_68562/m.61597 type:complete len:130 (+) Transcript_68562:3-392(+)